MTFKDAVLEITRTKQLYVLFLSRICEQFKYTIETL